MDFDWNAIGSMIYVQAIGMLTPYPMTIVTSEGVFFGMVLYEGFEQIRKGDNEDLLEILFLALGHLKGEQEYFRWLKEGEEPQLKPPVSYYRVLDILRMKPGYKF